MADILRHHFVSAKSESSDPTLVSKNEWNEGHDFTGGSNGQILVYDNTQPNNIRWTDGPKLYSPANFILTNANSPVNNLTPLNFTSTTAIAISVFLSIVATTTGAVNWFIDAYVDGFTINGASVHASGAHGLVIRSVNRPAGSHTITVNIYNVGNVVFPTINANLAVNTIGV